MSACHLRILFASMLWLSQTVWAAPPMDIGTAAGQGDKLLLDILEASASDTNNSISPPAATAGWITQRTPVRTVGFKPHGVWFKTELTNSSFQSREMYVQVGKPYMDKVDCFVNAPNGHQNIYRMGDKTFFETRPLVFKDFVIPIEIEAFGSKQLICFIKNDGATVADFQLWNPHDFQQKDSQHSTFRAFNYGAIVFAAIAGIFLGIWYRSWLFIFLVADLLPSLLGIASLHGDGFQTLWPMTPSWNLPPYYWLYAGSLTVSLVLFGLIQMNKAEKNSLRVLACTELLFLAVSVANPAWGTLLAQTGFAVSFALGFACLLICVRHFKDGPVAKVLAFCLGLQIAGNLINAFGLFFENTLVPAGWDFQLAGLVSSVIKALALVFVIALRLSEDRQRHLKMQQAHTKDLEAKLAYETQVTNLLSNHPKYNIPNQATFQSSIASLNIADQSCLSVWIIKLNRMDYLKSLLPESHIIHAIRDQVNNFGYALQHEYRDRLLKIRKDQYIAALDDNTLAFCTFGAADDNMRQAVEKFWIKPQKQHDMFLAWSPYFGVAEISKAAASLDALSQAQMALTDCSPQHRLQVFDPVAQAKQQRTFGVTLDIEGATERGELTLHYQPKVTLSTGCTDSMEALARWRHPSQGMIPPDVFIPEAEATGAILKLTLWAIAHAAEFMQSIDDPHLRVAINISAFDLASPGFTKNVLQTLKKSNTSASRFIFELTESTAIDDLPKTIAVLTTLREAGAQIASDDFGTGHSTLGILEKLPVNELKIDRSFCQDLLENPQKQALMQTMIELGKRMGFTVTVEGVENRDIVTWLSLYGCDTVQGYTFSRPLPAADAHAWMMQEKQGADDGHITSATESALTSS